MALPKERSQEIKISFREWKEMSDTLGTIRSFAGADDKYNGIECPVCGLTHFWIPDEEKTKITCLCGHYEFQLCECGEALTEENKSPFESGWCVKCRKDWAHSEKLCPECEKELEYVEEIGWAKGMLHCPNGCIDPIPEELYWGEGK